MEFLSSFEDTLYPIVCKINEYLSNYILLILLVGMGLYYTIRTRFVQIRCFGEGMKHVFGNISLKGGKQKSGMSSFQALATAIAAQVGTGNIVGACGAILIGGPGAIFWMWVIAFFGMATIYGEAILAQKTREVDADGNIQGGPVYYIRTAFKGGFGKFLATFFAIAATLALGFMGAMVQSNSIAQTSSDAFGIPTWVIGIILVVIAGIIFIGGISRIASVTEKLVPIMACLYLLGGIIIIISRIQYIPATFALIFKCAFAPQSLMGGAVGAAIYAAVTQGAKRGLFSNEAGMGSTPHAHALANVDDPHKQGISAMIGVFIDTFVVLTMTALVVISTLFTDGGPLSTAEDVALNAATETLTKTNLAQSAFATLFGGNIANIFVAVCLLFFAFSTILGWNLFAKINFQYLFNKKGTIIFFIISLAFIFLGSVLSNDLVWELTDMFNNLMVIPNALALFVLGAIVAKSAKDGAAKHKASKKK